MEFMLTRNTNSLFEKVTLWSTLKYFQEGLLKVAWRKCVISFPRCKTPKDFTVLGCIEFIVWQLVTHQAYVESASTLPISPPIQYERLSVLINCQLGLLLSTSWLAVVTCLVKPNCHSSHQSQSFPSYFHKCKIHLYTKWLIGYL